MANVEDTRHGKENVALTCGDFGNWLAHLQEGGKNSATTVDKSWRPWQERASESNRTSRLCPPGSLCTDFKELPCPAGYGDVFRNTFGQSFRIAADHCNAHFKHDGFETSIMEVNRDDIRRFIDALHYTLDQK